MPVLILLAAVFRLQAQTVSIDRAASRIYVVTQRTGLIKFLGHQHAILAEQWWARICWNAALPPASRAQFVIATRSLTIDADSARALAGLGKGPASRQREQIQRKLLDAEHLDVTSHPELHFESTSMTGDSSALLVHGRLTIKGMTREVQLPVDLDFAADHLVRMTGRLTVRQSAFGIRPESIAGVVKVADPVDIHVQLSGRVTTQTCEF